MWKEFQKRIEKKEVLLSGIMLSDSKDLVSMLPWKLLKTSSVYLPSYYYLKEKYLPV